MDDKRNEISWKVTTLQKGARIRMTEFQLVLEIYITAVYMEIEKHRTSLIVEANMFGFVHATPYRTFYWKIFRVQRTEHKNRFDAHIGIRVCIRYTHTSDICSVFECEILNIFPPLRRPCVE